MPMKMFMREDGKMTRLMDMECTIMQMEQGTRENGKKTSSKDLERKCGQMVLVTGVSIGMGRRKDRESSVGQMEAAMWESLRTTTSMEEAFTSGVMRGHSRETGRRTR